MHAKKLKKFHILTWYTDEQKLCSSKGFVASDSKISIAYGKSKSPKKSVDSLGNCVGILSMEQTKIPGPLKLQFIKSAIY